jgi:hypothetical protein
MYPACAFGRFTTRNSAAIANRYIVIPACEGMTNQRVVVRFMQRAPKLIYE